MKYYNVVKDIILFYKKYINSYELKVLRKIEYLIKDKEDLYISDEIVCFINKLLDRIWNLTITDIKKYDNEEEFCFLVKNIDIFIENEHKFINQNKVLKSFYIKENKYNFIDINDDKYELITKNNINSKNINDYGEIISINYTNNIRTTPLLPIYFNNGPLYIKNINYNIIGYFKMNNNLKKFDPALNFIEKYSLKNNKELLLIDKIIYDDKQFTDKEIDELIGIFLYRYYKSENFDIELDFYKLKKVLIKRDISKIKKDILAYYNKKITFEVLKIEIDEIIENRSKCLTKIMNK